VENKVDVVCTEGDDGFVITGNVTVYFEDTNIADWLTTHKQIWGEQIPQEKISKPTKKISVDTG
jgi:hypothetical protein